MTEQINANLVLNLEGLLCPLPIVKVSQAIKQVEIGQMIEASATDPGVMIDIPAWARTTGNMERIVKEAERLDVEEVVVTECGHAYATSRWEALKWFDRPWKFKVRSILEVMDDYIRLGRVRLDPSRNDGISVTYHDSCNLGRNGGLFEEPRRILQACIKDFREMTPNRRQSICCGGGGGLVALPDYDEVRLKVGEPKAKQIRATGAETVVASCDNCRHQLGQLNEHYKLNVNVVGLAELMANAIVPQKKWAP